MSAPVSLFPPLTVSLSSGMLNTCHQRECLIRESGNTTGELNGPFAMTKEVQTADRNTLLFKQTNPYNRGVYLSYPVS